MLIKIGKLPIVRKQEIKKLFIGVLMKKEKKKKEEKREKKKDSQYKIKKAMAISIDLINPNTLMKKITCSM